MTVTVIAVDGEHITMTDAAGVFVTSDKGNVCLAAVPKGEEVEYGANEKTVLILKKMPNVEVET